MSTPEIDLTSPAAVVTRAFMESFWITMLSRMEGGYPGYSRVIETLPKYDFRWTNAENQQEDGTVYFRLLRLARTPVGGWESVVCMHLDAATTYQVGAKYVSSDASQETIDATTIVWRPPVPPGPQRTSAGYGPASYPVNDVFKGWSVEESLPFTSSKADLLACMDPANNPVPQEDRHDEELTFDRPLPALAPVPGWPENEDTVVAPTDA
ncbi:hypothetical protein [Williamsia soli]|uniref:hypothetical protein n=1 Tax=Williamsia soli TaxID=364929 RepID=UPI001A9E85B1|nr:hypothetical protein [Williamsia soli]